jgi:hypothetical protein
MRSFLHRTRLAHVIASGDQKRPGAGFSSWCDWGGPSGRIWEILASSMPVRISAAGFLCPASVRFGSWRHGY